jgi:hypothetical protein
MRQLHQIQSFLIYLDLPKGVFYRKVKTIMIKYQN